MRRLIEVFAAAVLAITGCERTASSSPQWDPAHAGRPLRADDVDQLLLDPAQLSQVVSVRAKATTTQG